MKSFFNRHEEDIEEFVEEDDDLETYMTQLLSQMNFHEEQAKATWKQKERIEHEYFEVRSALYANEGYRYQEELTQKAENLGISNKVIWHGFCKSVKEEIKDSKMFVLSSDYEGISNSMLEAIAMGVPTITTDCPIYGARCYIQNNISGVLTPVGDRESLVNAMVKVAEDDAFAEKLSINGAAIRNQYSVSGIARRFLQAAELE